MLYQILEDHGLEVNGLRPSVVHIPPASHFVAKDCPYSIAQAQAEMNVLYQQILAARGGSQLTENW